MVLNLFIHFYAYYVTRYTWRGRGHNYSFALLHIISAEDHGGRMSRSLGRESSIFAGDSSYISPFTPSRQTPDGRITVTRALKQELI